jgi:hypothetical protein
MADMVNPQAVWLPGTRRPGLEVIFRRGVSSPHSSAGL